MSQVTVREREDNGFIEVEVENDAYVPRVRHLWLTQEDAESLCLELAAHLDWEVTA